MKLLLDINVLLDVLLQRDPWAKSAAHLLTRIEEGDASGFVAGPDTVSVLGHVVRMRQPPNGLVSTSTLPPC